jgi:hypothetical protein
MQSAHWNKNDCAKRYRPQSERDTRKYGYYDPLDEYSVSDCEAAENNLNDNIMKMIEGDWDYGYEVAPFQETTLSLGCDSSLSSSNLTYLHQTLKRQHPFIFGESPSLNK